VITNRDECLHSNKYSGSVRSPKVNPSLIAAKRNN